MAKRKAREVVPAEPVHVPQIHLGQNYYSNVALGVSFTARAITTVRIAADGLQQEVLGVGAFEKEFYRDLLLEEWSALVKFLGVALRNSGNSHMAIFTLQEGFNMKLKELSGKTMDELVAMHNELAKAKGSPTVEKFKTLEAGRIAVVKLANTATAGVKTKEAASAAKSAEKGGGVEGRPRSGVGAFAKAELLKGGTNAEVLERVKKEFPSNSTTVSCIAYYRNKLVKAGQLEGGRKPKAEKPAKEAKAEPRVPATPKAKAEAEAKDAKKAKK